MYRRLFPGVLVLVAGFFSAQLHAQVDSIERPRRANISAAAETNTSEARRQNDEAEGKRLYKIGVKYGTAGLYQQAAEMFERAVKLKPDYADAYLSLGHAYYDLRLWEPAVDNLQRGLALKPGDKDSRRRLAEAERMLKPDSGSRRTELSANGERTSSFTKSSPIRRTSATEKSAANDDALTRIYRVGPGDVLDVRLTDDVPAESTSFTVSAAGFLEHPGLRAPVRCAGLTVEDIAERIENDSKLRLSPNPKVSVAVQEYISHTIIVSGLVKDAGTKSLKREGIPLYVVIADAQPLPEAGQVSVQRNSSNETFLIDLLEISALNMLVRPGDVINLLERPPQFFYVSGRVNSPGEKTFRRGLTLTQAIIAAGGLGKDAKKAQLARDNGHGFLIVTSYKLKDIQSGKMPDPAVQPGDRITISK